MTMGVGVFWDDAEGKLFEIEYFCGIDVNHLDHVPEFTTVPAIWPRYRELLRRRCLPPSTLERVRATLAHPQFQNRPRAR